MSNTSVVVILAVSQIYIEQNQRKFENKLKNDPLGKGDIEIIISYSSNNRICLEYDGATLAYPMAYDTLYITV